MSNRFSVNAAGQIISTVDGQKARLNMAGSAEKIAAALNLVEDLATLAAWPTGYYLDYSCDGTPHGLEFQSALIYDINIHDMDGAVVVGTFKSAEEALHAAAEKVRELQAAKP